MLDVMYLHTGMNNECYAYFAYNIALIKFPGTIGND
jgi:hypothetical protein